MSLANLSPLALFGGLAAIAGLLFLLQRLRVRYRPVPVITTLFWREAAEESRARVLVRRFRHPLAYLLVLLIAALLWTALAEPRSDDREPVDRVLLLDTSAIMGWTDQDDETAVAALVERVASMPDERRTVFACGSIVRPLLLPGEPVPLLEERLVGVRPEATPSSIEGTIRDLAATRADGRQLEIEVFGFAPLGSSWDRDLLEGVEVRRAVIDGVWSHRPGKRSTPTDDGSNEGIVALGASAARSGAWDRVDVMVRLAFDAQTVAAGLDGDFGLKFEHEIDAEGTHWFRDLPAAGGTFEVRVTEDDSFPFDDDASLVLPNRPRLRVALSSGAASLRAVLEADPAVRLVEGDADVAVRFVGETTGGDVPALELVDEATQEEAFLLVHERGRDSEEVLLESFDRLGLDEIDAIELAEATQKTIALGATPGDRRAVRVWSSLLDPRYDFTRSRSFPLFVATSIRWLAGDDRTPAWVAVSEAVEGTEGAGAWTDEAGRTLDPVGAALVPPSPGRYTSESRGVIHASLFDPVATRATGEYERQGEFGPEIASTDVAAILAVLAAALLLVEWWIFRTGRMP